MTFREDYWFMSNMYPINIKIGRITYACAEAAFQAMKTTDTEERKAFSKVDGFMAKKMGRRVQLRSDWEAVKDKMMEKVLRIKFKDEGLMRKLKAIKGEIVEDNTWHDTYWGRCNGIGQNRLGKILMAIRDEA